MTINPTITDRQLEIESEQELVDRLYHLDLIFDHVSKTREPTLAAIARLDCAMDAMSVEEIVASPIAAERIPVLVAYKTEREAWRSSRKALEEELGGPDFAKRPLYHRVRLLTRQWVEMRRVAHELVAAHVLPSWRGTAVPEAVSRIRYAAYDMRQLEDTIRQGKGTDAHRRLDELMEQIEETDFDLPDLQVEDRLLAKLRAYWITYRERQGKSQGLMDVYRTSFFDRPVHEQLDLLDLEDGRTGRKWQRVHEALTEFDVTRAARVMLPPTA